MSGPSGGDERRRAIQELDALPDTTDPNYPPRIRSVIEQTADPEHTFNSILIDRTVPYDVRFNALYAILLRLRREERFTEYASTVRLYEREFSTEPYFYTFRAIVAQMLNTELSGLRNAILYSREAATRMPNVAGVVHQYSTFLVEYLERVESPGKPSELRDAEEKVNQAITLSHSTIGHYFETKARVLALMGEFASARAAVSQAIELEPRASRDYLRRLAQYQATRVRIDLLEQQARWKRSQDSFKEELSGFKAQQLELLGLLAAVVAFVAATSNIASQSKGIDGVRLMVVMSGSVILVFAAFSLLGSRPMGRVAAALLIGILLVVLGLEFPSWLVKN